MIQGFEILGIIFLLFMIYITFISYKRKTLSNFSASFWFLIWISGTIALIFSKYLKMILPSLSIYRIFDLYTIIGFMFFLFMIFYLFKIIKRTEKRVEDLTRTLALKSIDKEKK